jgi:hypothetical protein
MLLDALRTDRAVELRCERGVFVNWQDLGLAATQMRVRVGDRSGQRSVRLWDGSAGKRTRLLEKLLLKNGVREQEVSELALQALRSIWETIRHCDEGAPSSDDRLLLSVDDARRLNPDWWRLNLVADDETLFRCETCGRLHAVGVRSICPRHRCPGALRAVRRGDLESNHYRSLYEESLPGSLRVEEHTAQLDNEKAREFQQEFREGKIQVLSCSTTFELGVDLGDLDVVFLRNVPPEAFNYTQRVGRAGRRSRDPGFAVTYCRRGPHDLYHFAEPQRMLSGRTRPPVLTLGNEKIVGRHIAATALSAFFRAFPERFKDVASLLVDFHKPTASEDFRAFLKAGRAQIEKALRDIVPSDMDSRLGLNDGGWIVNIAGEESRLARVETETSSDYKAVAGLEATAAQRGDYETARWARARAQTIAAENALSFLSRKVVIPKYGFPVDVVELDTHRTQRSKTSLEVSLQRDLALAISEFAPSNSLVANKKTWTSYALKRVAEKEWPRKQYKKCAHDNVFFQWERGQSEPPAPCGHQLLALQYIVPSFGFLTTREEPKRPTSRPARIFTTRPYFVARQGPDTGIIDFPSLSIEKTAPGLMVVLCEGRRGEGFYVCGQCGAGFRRPERAHETALGQQCRGILEPVSLGHEFVTDVLRLQFHGRPEVNGGAIWFAHSLAYALLEGAAEILEVPSSDLNATVTYGGDPARVPPIVLYDNVPGGAGLVARLQEGGVLKSCLEAAHRRVEGGCGCDATTSCYGCLRSYRNQFAHQQLQRGAVERYLAAILSTWQD